jgi:NAD-dependent histone deacetylase SIR2
MSRKSLVSSTLNLDQFKLNHEALLKLKNAEKFIFITGAGISTSSGIPDFRGANGIYKTNAMTMMDANWVYRTPENLAEYLNFIGKFTQLSLSKDPTSTHYLFRNLRDEGKLLRVYSQNIDNFEERAGLKVGMEEKDEVLSLHGNLGCVICKRNPSHKFRMSEEYIEAFVNGKVVTCPACLTEKPKLNLKPIVPGWLRPAILLYNEPDSDGEQISKLVTKDAKTPNTVLIVMGSTLHVQDAVNVMTNLSNAVRKKKGLVLLVNREDIAHFRECFDFRIMCDADDFSAFLSSLVLKSQYVAMSIFFFFLMPSSSFHPLLLFSL